LLELGPAPPRPLYNTIYTQRAPDHLAAAGHAIRDEDIERLSPLGHEHITLTGHY
jgi:hypothetical protein